MKSLFNNLSTYYWNTIQERQSISDLVHRDSWIDALIHYCNYAFERAGSPTIYRKAAKEAFRRNLNWLDDRKRWSSDIENRIFETFTQVCKESFLENYNLKNNPMRPSGGGQISMIRFAWYETEDKSITNWASTRIDNDELLSAFEKLRKIRGVGSKISSFYLRDIYILSGNTNRNIRDRHLLQPIDVWTRRAARCFLDDENASDKQCAEFLIEYEDNIGILNGSLNIAFWVLGSQIAEDEKTFVELVQGIKQGNRNSLRRQLAEKISNEREWIAFLETVHNGL